MANLNKLPFNQNLSFNPKHSTRMHIDLNSCFASVEQQANPYLRNRPVGVAAYEGPSGCIIAPSFEAKALGVKTGYRVKDGLLIAPNMAIVGSDPDRYRTVHLRLKHLLLQYTDNLEPKSIDEFVLNLEGTPCFKKGLHNVAREIKARIRQEIGDWLRVNVGIAPNRFLAKLAASLHKPDGLDEINQDNFLDIYSKLELRDLCGIDRMYSIRLHQSGILTVTDMFQADQYKLKSAFRSIEGYKWYLRLRGWEVDDLIFPRRSFGNSYALPMNLSTPRELAPLLMKLVDKTGFRMRRGGFKARGVHVGVEFRSGNHWHLGSTTDKLLYDSSEIFKEMFLVLSRCPYREPVRILSECAFNLKNEPYTQPSLFDDLQQFIGKDNKVKAVDKIKNRFGQFSIIPASMMGTGDIMPDRVSFGGVKELFEHVMDEEMEDIDYDSDDIYLEV